MVVTVTLLKLAIGGGTLGMIKGVVFGKIDVATGSGEIDRGRIICEGGRPTARGDTFESSLVVGGDESEA